VLAALIISFREAFEVGLIVGIVLVATRGVVDRNTWLTAAIVVGLAITALFALMTSALKDVFAAQQDLFNAIMLLLAVMMLTWHIMVIQRHSDQSQPMVRSAAAAVAAGHRTMISLAVVVATAVVREGFELVLLLYGVRVVASGGEVLAGGTLGVLTASIITAAMYRGLMQFPTRALFLWSSRILIFFTAGLASQATLLLQHADAIKLGQSIVWNSEWILPANSLVGQVMHVLFGYSDAPTVLQLATYVVVIALIFTIRAFQGILQP
jgi:high-affinity iron transporter